MKTKYCRCEPGWFAENKFYTDPNGVEFHLVPGQPHVTSTCDNANPPSGPGTLIYKLIVGAAIESGDNVNVDDIDSSGKNPPPTGPTPLIVDPESDIFEVLPGKSPEDLVDLLYFTDRRLADPDPIPLPAVRVLGELIPRPEQERLIQLGQSGQDIRLEVNRNMAHHGIRLSNSNLDLLKSFLMGGIDDLTK